MNAARPVFTKHDRPDAFVPSEAGYRKALQILAPRENRRMKMHGDVGAYNTRSASSKVGIGVLEKTLQEVIAAGRPVCAKELADAVGRRHENVNTSLRELYEQGKLTRTRGRLQRDPYFYEVAK